MKFISRGILILGMFALVSVITPNEALGVDAFCNPIQTLAFANADKRVHVLCSQSISGVKYFALKPDDANLVSRVLSIISTAQVAGRTLVISYDPNPVSGAGGNCNPADCRWILAIGFNN